MDGFSHNVDGYLKYFADDSYHEHMTRELYITALLYSSLVECGFIIGQINYNIRFCVAKGDIVKMRLARSISLI